MKEGSTIAVRRPALTPDRFTPLCLQSPVNSLTTLGRSRATGHVLLKHKNVLVPPRTGDRQVTRASPCEWEEMWVARDW